MTNTQLVAEEKYLIRKVCDYDQKNLGIIWEHNSSVGVNVEWWDKNSSPNLQVHLDYLMQ